jgi:hypothetical protein
LAAHFLPVQQLLAGTGGTFIGLDGEPPVGLDVAEHDVHIVGGAGDGGGLPRIPVGQSGDDLVREMLGHAIDEVQHRAYGGAVPLVHLPAFVALAVSVIVVLGDGPVSGGGLLCHVLLQVFQDDGEHFGV